ncbi:hypothetical protein GCM10007385_27690 [Tateyamaria omphalii]|uniref:hypothetical protein n=1 Tax=Tateyamaria omphalii TaxID=299262 RepID=UPI001676577E|nr:hypothetical protein [Tateyamaria omphalii]GGX57287.1 hypothetical protein GCM10007385_27690 [Tateyamaria omphalii]
MASALVIALNLLVSAAMAQTLGQDEIERTLATAIGSCTSELTDGAMQRQALVAAGIDLIDPERPSVTWQRDTGQGSEFLDNPAARTIYQPVGTTDSCAVFLFRPDLNYATSLKLAKTLLQQNGWDPATRSSSKYNKGTTVIELRGNTEKGLFHSIRLRRKD